MTEITVFTIHSFNCKWWEYQSLHFFDTTADDRNISVYDSLVQLQMSVIPFLATLAQLQKRTAVLTILCFHRKWREYLSLELTTADDKKYKSLQFLCSTVGEGNNSPWLFFLPVCGWRDNYNSLARLQMTRMSVLTILCFHCRWRGYSSLARVYITGISVFAILWLNCARRDYQSLQLFGSPVENGHFKFQVSFILSWSKRTDSFASTNDKRNLLIVAHYFPFMRFTPPPQWNDYHILLQFLTFHYFRQFFVFCDIHLFLSPFAHTLSYPLHSSVSFTFYVGGCMAGVIDSGSEYDIGEPSPNSSRVRYIH